MQIVIVGAGYAGLTTAIRLARSRIRGRIILINDRPEHQLTTQLHKIAAGAVPSQLVLLSLQRLLHNTGVELIIGRVTAIEPKSHQVWLDDGQRVPYDRLVVTLGSQVETFGVPGVMEHAFHIQPYEQASRLRAHIAERCAWAAAQHRNLHFVIVGGGLTGVEFAGELADTLPAFARTTAVDRDRITITLMEAGSALLPGLAPFLSDESAAILDRKGVKVQTNTAIKAITDNGVVVNDGAAPLQADAVIWTAGVRGHNIVEAAFRSGARGRAIVDEFLRAADYPNVYIVGDNALAVSKGAEQAAGPTAQNAVQQAAVAADNIAAEARRRPGDPEPQLTPYVAKPLGLFVSVGQAEAVGELVFGDVWRPRLSGLPAYALKWASEQRYKLGIGASLGA